MSADKLFGMLLNYHFKCIYFCTTDFILDYYYSSSSSSSLI